jgi:hypothetical protein
MKKAIQIVLAILAVIAVAIAWTVAATFFIVN